MRFVKVFYLSLLATALLAAPAQAKTHSCGDITRDGAFIGHIRTDYSCSFARLAVRRWHHLAPKRAHGRLLYWFNLDDDGINLYSMSYRTQAGVRALFYTYRKTGYESGWHLLQNYGETRSISWRTSA